MTYLHTFNTHNALLLFSVTPVLLHKTFCKKREIIIVIKPLFVFKNNWNLLPLAYSWQCTWVRPLKSLMKNILKNKKNIQKIYNVTKNIEKNKN